VTDANLNPVGALSQPPVQDTTSRLQFCPFDGKHRILSLVNDGIGFINTSSLNPVLAPGEPPFPS
jgi:hypothetical protein